MTTTPQSVLLSEQDLLDAWSKHTAVSGYKTYSLREHVLRAMRDVEQAALAKLQATQAEPVQAGELPDFGLIASMLDSYVGAIKETGQYDRWHYIPEVEHQAAATRAALSARGQADHLPDVRKMVPLTPAQMEKGRDQIFSINNPYCPCDSKTFRKVAEWVERHHGINGLEVKPSTEQGGKL